MAPTGDEAARTMTTNVDTEGHDGEGGRSWPHGEAPLMVAAVVISDGVLEDPASNVAMEEEYAV